MNTWQTFVTEFHRKFGVPVGRSPFIDQARVPLRASLIHEEMKETIDAMYAGDLTETADGLADLIYVAIGAAVEFGIDLDAVFKEVHASNMTKEGGGTRADGKILKGPHFRPPRIATILAAQMDAVESGTK